MSRRDDFSQTVKNKLAERAGHQCSICSTLTIGPSEEGNDKVNKTGVAAHISAASPGPGARRYDDSLSPDQRSSIDNGIWLCTSHADLIDGDEITFTTEYLKKQKNDHEAKIKYKQSGLNVDIGLITKIKVCNFGKIVSPLELDLKLNNIIIGPNESGKTLICELIAAFSNRKHLLRWKKKENEGNSFFEILFFKYQALSFKISSNYKGDFAFIINDKESPIFISPFKAFFLSKSFKYKSNLGLIDEISEYFNIEKFEFISLISQMAIIEKFLISDFILDDSGNFKVRLKENKYFLPFTDLSAGEQDETILEIGLCMAKYYSNFISTILIIDNEALGSLDASSINNFLKIIIEKNFNFQTLINLINRREPYQFYDFNVMELELRNNMTEIRIHRLH